MTTQAVTRTWSDATGQLKVDATFVKVSGDTVQLKRADGRTVSIPIDKLSQADQDHLKKVMTVENPFQLD